MVLAHLGRPRAGPSRAGRIARCPCRCVRRARHFTPVAAREKARATFASSGWRSESPVTRTVSQRAWSGRPGAERAWIERVRGHRRDRAQRGAGGRLVEAAGPRQCVVGVRPADELVLDASRARGRRTPRLPGGRRRARASAPTRRFISSPEWRIERPSKASSSSVQQADADQRVARGEVAPVGGAGSTAVRGRDGRCRSSRAQNWK